MGMITMTTKVSSVARSVELKARRTRLKGSTWMGDHQERPGAVNLGRFIDVDLKL